MSHFRFIHAADLHLGSQLQKLERYPGAPIERIRSAPQRAVENLVDLAIDGDVAALLIAGDLLDGPWNDVRIGLWLVQQFRRLERANIRVYCIRGNHDAISVVRNVIRWPDNVFEFTAEPSTAPPLECGLVVHGQSFEKIKVTENIASGYPAAIDGAFNVGLLHTSLMGSSLHDTYAPTDLQTLRNKGYQYWALGHIHLRSLNSHADDFWAGFSGNTQGRNVRESGAKGCYMVDVTDRQIDSVQFLPTDVARWTTLDLDVSRIDTISELQDEIRHRIELSHHESEGRVLAVRVNLTGSSPLHQPLGNPSQLEDLSMHLRAFAGELDDVWLEKIVVATRPLQTESSLSQTNALLAEVLSVSRSMQAEICEAESASIQALEESRKLMESKLGPYLRELGWASESDPNWRGSMEPWLHQATQYLLQAFSGSATSNNAGSAVPASHNPHSNDAARTVEGSDSQRALSDGVSSAPQSITGNEIP